MAEYMSPTLVRIRQPVNGFPGDSGASTCLSHVLLARLVRRTRR